MYGGANIGIKSLPMLTRFYVGDVEVDIALRSSGRITWTRQGLKAARAGTAAIAVVALVGACGGSYSKQDFIARANGICTSALRQTRAIAPAVASQSNQALAAYLSQALPIVESEAQQLRALRLPPGTANEKAALARYFAALTVQVATIKQLRNAAARGDAQGVAAAKAALGANPATSLAAQYGLRACGIPGGTAA